MPPNASYALRDREDYETNGAVHTAGGAIRDTPCVRQAAAKKSPRDSRFERPDLQREARHYFTLNAAFSETRPERLRRIAGIPGRAAPEYLALNLSVLESVRHFAKAGKPLPPSATVRQILAPARVIEGSALSAYPRAPEVELAGANYADIAIDAR